MNTRPATQQTIRQTLSCLLILFFWTNASGQSNQWTYVKGETMSSYFGIYGTAGLASAANTPGARYDAEGAFINGKYYYFGGHGFTSATSIATFLNEVWSFDPATNNWTYIRGGSQQQSVYGTKGVSAPANTPGSRLRGACWSYNNKMYVFSGVWNGYHSDLWEFDPATNGWTWINGSDQLDVPGTYGTKGVAAASNLPGGRRYTVSWVCNNKLYMFGGYGVDATGAEGALGDLWVYDPATGKWTWLKGSNEIESQGVTGTKGVAAAANTPSSRYGSVTWVANNKLYLFGGSATGMGETNDLWEYNPATGNWTWLSGSPTGSSGFGGTQGVAASNVVPGEADMGVGWTVGNTLYLGTGSGSAPGGSGKLNDIWSYNLTTGLWTWVKGSGLPNQSGAYGTQGTGALANSPGARESAVAFVSGSDLYLVGGSGLQENGANSRLNDVWKFQPSSNNWTWLKGAKSDAIYGNYGTKGVADPANAPGGRELPATWQYNSKLYMFGGTGFAATGSSSWLSDLWEFDPATGAWTWLKGDNTTAQFSVFGTKGVAASTNNPGGRTDARGWVANGRFYMFGGQGKFPPNIVATRGDLWEYNPSTNNWTWLSGDTVAGAAPVYGTMGVADAANKPGARYGYAAWTLNGKLYLFGGNGGGIRNDLWEYDLATGLWTWLKGDNVTNQMGVFGTTGVASPANKPGAKYGSATWVLNGKLYLFGGHGNLNNTFNQYNNDLWEYDPATNNWRFVKGNNSNIGPVYGTMGVASASNMPGARRYTSAWVGGNNKLYMFGGYGFSSAGTIRLNDLWEFNPATNNWTWLKGQTLGEALGVYGTAGVASAITQPGSRYGGASWTLNDNFYLFGGNGLNANAPAASYLPDLMYYTPQLCVPVTPAITVSAPVTSVCQGSLLSFSSAIVSGGAAPAYQWQFYNGTSWSNLSGATTSAYSSAGLASGKIRCVLTSNDPCATVTTATSNEITISVSAIQISTVSQTAVNCYGGSDGAAQIAVSGGSAPYSYLWDNPSASITSSISNLPAGVYHVIVTDNIGCSKTGQVTITQPLAVSISAAFANDVSCHGGSDGSIVTMTLGGNSVYSYNWSPSGGSGGTASGLTAGTYTVTATDGNGCTGTGTFVVSEPLPLTVTASSQNDVSCNGLSDGAISLSVSGGSGGIDLTWTPGNSHSSTRTGLSAGTHTVTVKDGNNCTVVRNFTVTEPAALTSAETSTGISCHGNDDGAASVTVAGGTSPYSYTWTGTVSSSNTVTGLAPGNYGVSVVDAHGCTVSNSFTISEPAVLTVSTGAVSNASCHGLSDGSAEALASGGTAPYTYLWDDAASSATATATGLAAGTYHCNVTDAHGCTESITVIIAQPAALPAPTLSITPTVVCPGYETTLTAAAANAGSNPSYQWLDNGSSVGTNSASYTGLLQPGHIISCVVTSSEACSPVPAATSNSVAVPSVPAAQATDLSYLNVASTQIKINFKRGSGNGGALVVLSQGAPLNMYPVCGTSYTAPVANPVDFADPGLSVIGNGKVVYRNSTNILGTSLNVTINNVTAGRYYINVFEYNSSSNGPVYLAPALQSDTLVILPMPSVNVSGVDVSGILANRATVEWTNGNGDGGLVVLTTSDADLPSPQTNTFYLTDTIYGLGQLLTGQSYAMYSGNGSSIEVTGLNPLTKYTAWVCEYSLDGPYIRYRPMVKKVFRTSADSYTVTTNGVEIAEDFNTLSTSADAEIASGRWQFAESGTGSDYYFQPSGGNPGAAGVLSFGNNTDRALGTYTTTGTTAQIGIRYVNKTNDTITSLLVSYTGEQWYRGAPNGVADQLRFFYSTTANVLDNGTYIRVPELDFLSPVTTGGGAMDGNVPANRTSHSASITGLNILPNEDLWIKFNDVVTSGGNDGLAIDDFTAIPFSTTIIGNGDIVFNKLNDLNIVGGTATSQMPCLTVSKALHIGDGSILDISSVSGKKTLNISDKLPGNGTISSNENSMISVGGAGLNQTLRFTPGFNKLKNLWVRANAVVNLGSPLRVSSLTKGQVIVGGNNGAGTLNTNNLLTLESDSIGSGSIGKVNGSISGSIEVQRHIRYRDALRFVSHPFSSSIPVSEIGDDIPLSFTSGAENCWWYDGDGATPGSLANLAQDASWTGIGSGGFAWNPYQALRISKSAGEALLDFNGVVNQGNISIPLNWGPDSFLVVGNPYPAVLKPGNALAAAALAGTINDAAIYTWDPTKSTNGAFVTIPNSQFASAKLPANSAFVVVTGGNSGTLDFTEADKTLCVSTKTYFRDGEEIAEMGDEEEQAPDVATPQGLRLSLKQGDITDDELYVFFSEDAAAGKEKTDAAKLMNPGLSFYSNTSEGKLAIDSRPFEAGTVIPLGLANTREGNYIIAASDWNLPAGAEIYLVDRYTGREVLLGQQAAYAFSLGSNNQDQGTGRFYLRMGKSPGANSTGTLKIELTPNPAKNIVFLSVPGEQSGTADIRILSMTGQEVISQRADVEQNKRIKIDLKDIPSGMYLAEINFNGQTITSKLMIQ